MTTKISSVISSNFDKIVGFLIIIICNLQAIIRPTILLEFPLDMGSMATSTLSLILGLRAFICFSSYSATNVSIYIYINVNDKI